MAQLSRDEFIELRRDALVVLQAVAFAGTLALLIGTLLYTEVTRRAITLIPLSFVFGTLVVAEYARHRQQVSFATWTIICGLIAGPALFLWTDGLHPSVFYLFLVPVVAASVLIGSYAEFAVAAVVVGVMASVTFIHYPPQHIGELGQIVALLWAPSLVIVLTATLVHGQTQNTLALLRWTIDTQRKETRRAHLFYEQNEQLARLTHELEGANTDLGQANQRLLTLNTELAEARRVADSANRLKTQLLANVSHELRTPLHIILGMSQVALGGQGETISPTLHRDLQHILHSGEHLSRLIDDLLDLSRAEIDALELFREEIDTRAFLANIFASLADGIDPHGGVVWRLDLPTRLPTLHADPVRLRQIVLNLLANAKKYTTSGEIVLGAEVTPPHLHIWVTDTGRGIAIEQQDQIFEPFVTVPTPGQQHRGIGLGLSITRRLVSLHQGVLTLESAPERGSTFHVYLPLMNVQGQRAELPGATSPFVLLLSQNVVPSADIEAFSVRINAPLRRVQPDDDLHTILAEAQPVAIVWDAAGADERDWVVIEQLRQHPQFCLLPFMVYRQEPATGHLIDGLTNVFIKPLSETKLVDAVQALQPLDSSGSILIVDDDAHTRLFYERLLGQALPSYTIDTAEHGAAAMTMLAETIPSLVILDLMMPEVSGFEVLAWMREHPATRRVPVLILSGRVLSFDDVERLNYAGVVMQSKDIFTPDEFMAHIRQMVTNEEPHTQTTSGLVKEATAYIHQHYANPLTRADVAAHVGVTERYITRIFHAELGLSPWEYLTRFRIVQAKHLLQTSTDSVNAIATQVGFDDPAYFSRVFRREVGVTPSAYRTMHVVAL